LTIIYLITLLLINLNDPTVKLLRNAVDWVYVEKKLLNHHFLKVK